MAFPLPPLPEMPQLYGTITKLQQLSHVPHVLHRYELRPELVGAAVRHALQRVGLADCAERPSHTLSGGQKQRWARQRGILPGVGGGGLVAQGRGALIPSATQDSQLLR